MKKVRLTDILSTGITISHATTDKVEVETKEIQSLGKQIPLLENQVKYYKALQDMFNNFIEEILEDDQFLFIFKKRELYVI